MTAARVITEQDLATVAECIAQGIPAREIRALMKCAHNTLAAMMEKLGVRKPGSTPRRVLSADEIERLKDMIAEGLTAQERCKRLGMSEVTLRHLTRQAGIDAGYRTPFDWTPERLETLTALRSQGMAPTAIARQIGTTTDCIEYKLSSAAFAALPKVTPVRTETGARVLSEDELARLKDMIEAGVPASERCAVLSMAGSTLRRLTKEAGLDTGFVPGHDWTAEEEADLAEMLRILMPIPEIAVELGLKITTVKARIERLRTFGQKGIRKRRATTARKCIGRWCDGLMFQSWGPGNRLCPRCAGNAAELSCSVA